MYDKYMVSRDDIKEVVVDGVGKGFTIKTKIPYYRGVSLSLIEDVHVRFDGRLFPKEMLLFSLRGHQYTFSEMETMATLRWEYGEKAEIFVPLDGGIPLGDHRIELTVHIRISYLNGGTPYTVTIEHFSPMGG